MTAIEKVIERALNAEAEVARLTAALAAAKGERDRLRAERAHVTWIVSEPDKGDEGGEFGVLVGDRAFFYYKWPDTEPTEGAKYRPIHKREFGEVIRRGDLPRALAERDEARRERDALQAPAEMHHLLRDLLSSWMEAWGTSETGTVLRLLRERGEAEERIATLTRLLRRTSDYLETATNLIAENDVCVDEEDGDDDVADARSLIAEARSAIGPRKDGDE